MNYSKIATRYAKALFLAALEEQKIDLVYKDLEILQEIFKEDTEFSFFLQTPIISPDDKKKLLKNVFETNLNPLTYKFIILLTENRRENRLKDIIRNFFIFYNQHYQMVTANLITSYKIDENIINEFKTKLEQALSKIILFKNEIDENLIGGFILQIEDKEFDASIKNQLNKIKNNLENTSMIK